VSEHAREALRRVVRVAGKLSTTACCIGIFAIMLIAVVDVVGVRVMGQPIYGTTEMIEELTAFLVVCGLGLVQAEADQLRITLVLNRVSQRWCDLLNFLAYFIGLGVTSFLCWRSVALAEEYFTFHAAKQVEFYFPLWPTAVALSFGYLLLAIVLVCRLIEVVSREKAWKGNLSQ